ncbi:MAG: thermonuclease family protein [Magnetococcales bacterium]|nr:thermonuclease family protein [Magnetococcales bacterium]
MSFILDALKKSESEHAMAGSPNIATFVNSTGIGYKKSPSRSVKFIYGMIAVVAAIGIFIFTKFVTNSTVVQYVTQPVQQQYVAQPVQPVQQQYVAQPVQPVQQQQVSQPAQPVQQQQVSQPVKPVQQQQVSQLVKPLQRQQVSQPAQPVQQQHKAQPAPKQHVAQQVLSLQQPIVSSTVQSGSVIKAPTHQIANDRMVAEKQTNKEFLARVVGIKSGCLLEIKRDGKIQPVRLANVTCLHLKSHAGKMARRYLANKVFVKTVSVSVLSADASGTIIADIFTPDGLLLNRSLIQAGLAYGADKRFFSAEKDAERRKVGMWANLRQWLDVKDRSFNTNILR